MKDKPNCKMTKKENKNNTKKVNFKFSYELEFDVNNGLMSGWKMTSLFGSLFNLSLNKMCEKWSMMNSGDAVFNVNVMGDDSHIKRRYLIDSLNHVNFINAIDKVAHPSK